MAATLPIEIFRLLEDKLGKDEAVKVSSAIELSLGVIEDKANDLALQKKLELKDELTKELATKADLQIIRYEISLVETRLRAEIQQIKTELSAQQKLHFFIILFAIILANPKAIEIISKIFSVIAK